MEKQISKINISKDVLNGVSKQHVICPKCKKTFFTNIINKHRKQKIITVKCPKCKYNISIGNTID